MFRRGRRLFSIASILMILTFIAHTLGHLISFALIEIVFLLAVLIPDHKQA